MCFLLFKYFQIVFKHNFSAWSQYVYLFSKYDSSCSVSDHLIIFILTRANSYKVQNFKEKQNTYFKYNNLIKIAVETNHMFAVHFFFFFRFSKPCKIHQVHDITRNVLTRSITQVYLNCHFVYIHFDKS